MKRIVWGGFCNNKLHKTKEADTGYPIYAIYPSRRIAKLAYEDVRPLIIKQPRQMGAERG